MSDKYNPSKDPKKDVLEYTKRTGGRMSKAESDQSAATNRQMYEVSSSGSGNVKKANAEYAEQMRWINKGKLASKFARANRADARAAALEVMRKKTAFKNKGGSGKFINEPSTPAESRAIRNNLKSYK